MVTFVVAVNCSINPKRFAPNVFVYPEEDSWYAWAKFFENVKEGRPVTVQRVESDGYTECGVDYENPDGFTLN